MSALLAALLLACPAAGAAAPEPAAQLPAAQLPGDPLPGDPGEPVPLVADDVPSGVLAFEILDDAGRPIPGRLTFTAADGGPPPAFSVTDGAPEELAVRKNVVYSRSGRGALRVPAGAWRVWATRGIEWSAHAATVEVAPGGEARLRASLRRELDTRGWISGDFHLHTLTHSGHGDANLEERLITLVGEGVEFAVATDHNHNTDYGPVQRALGLEDALTTVTGNEVSVPIGHFNTFPLDPARPVPPTDATDANELFRLLRAEPNAYGVTPIVQLNHPRWIGIDYFNQAALDPVTRRPGRETFSYDFDTLEVLNAGEGWGYLDADVYEGPLGSSVHWVLGDWYALLNQGRRYTAVGNSDSHTVHFEFAGYPRNFVPSSTDAPSEVDVAEVAEALRAQRTFTTFGPFVEVRVEGAEPGGSTVAREGRVRVDVEVQAASWIDCDRVRFVLNGDVVSELAVPQGRDALRLRESVELEVPHDAWLAVLVEGDDPLAPVVAGGARDVLPWAVVNPVWIDADGDGEWTSPEAWAAAAVRAHEAAVSLKREVFEPARPSERALLLLAAADAERPYVNELVRAGLRSEHRLVRLTAARLAERSGDRSLAADLESAWERGPLPPFDALVLLRALEATGSDAVGRLFAELAKAGDPRLARYPDDLEALAPGTTQQAWTACGYFPAPEAGAVATTVFGPEGDPDTSAVHEGVGGPVAWVGRESRASGYVDLRGLAPAGGGTAGENAIAYAQAWLHAPDEREVAIALGTDDGARLWIGDELVHEDAGRHAASPFQTVVTAHLDAGWTRVLLKVENGAGEFGFYFRPLDDEVVLRSSRPVADPAD